MLIWLVHVFFSVMYIFAAYPRHLIVPNLDCVKRLSRLFVYLPIQIIQTYSTMVNSSLQELTEAGFVYQTALTYMYPPLPKYDMTIYPGCTCLFNMLIMLTYFLPLYSWSYVVFIHVSGWYICVCCWFILQGFFNYVPTFLTGKNTFWVSYSCRILVKEICVCRRCKAKMTY